ncbi:hypothetical protein HPP92_024310 [Vanilla planifolia]|uniref:Uncharacterized protein n=1 Tax=Vanilla planifolia TaxID=51239 RepID=A0A835PUW6_VANPL|nr:hypothetical protein HPP92_024310 [Vanilla planifolia]
MRHRMRGPAARGNLSRRRRLSRRQHRITFIFPSSLRSLFDGIPWEKKLRSFSCQNGVGPIPQLSEGEESRSSLKSVVHLFSDSNRKLERFERRLFGEVLKSHCTALRLY